AGAGRSANPRRPGPAAPDGRELVGMQERHPLLDRLGQLRGEQRLGQLGPVDQGELLAGGGVVGGRLPRGGGAPAGRAPARGGAGSSGGAGWGGAAGVSCGGSAPASAAYSSSTTAAGMRAGRAATQPARPYCPSTQVRPTIAGGSDRPASTTIGTTSGGASPI